MRVGCARAGGRWEQRQVSVGILFAAQGGFELCMHGVDAVGDDNPTDSLMYRHRYI